MKWVKPFSASSEIGDPAIRLEPLLGIWDLRYDCRWIADQGADTSSGLRVCLYSIMPQWQGQGSHIWQHWSECSYHDPCIMYTSISPHVAFRLLRQARMMDRDDSIYLACSQIGLGRWWDLISWTRPNENLIISNSNDKSLNANQFLPKRKSEN